MSTWMWLVICLMIALGSILLTWTIAENLAEAERARNLETIRVQKLKTLKAYDEKVGQLTKKNLNLQNELSKSRTEYRRLLSDRNRLKKAYDIKVSSAKGLEIASKQWRDAYIQIENELEAKETEHQKEIDDLTAYYKEQMVVIG